MEKPINTFILLIGICACISLSWKQSNSTQADISLEDSLTLDYLKSRISNVEAKQLKDSIVYYYRLQSQWYQQKDSLGRWYDSYWDLQYNFDSNSDSALIYLEEAIKEQWRAPANALEAESLLWIYASQAYHYFQKGAIFNCIKSCESADALYEQYLLTDFDMIDHIYKRQGTCYTMLGDNEKAQYIYEKALDLTQSEQDARNLGGLYNNIGITYWNQGGNQKAISFYQKGLELEGLPDEQAGLLNTSLAQSYLEMGEVEYAAEKVQIAVKQLKAIWRQKHPRIAQYLSTAYLIQGRIKHQQGLTDKAEISLRQALKMAELAFGEDQHRYSAKIYLALGQLLLERENHLPAIDYFNKALSAVIPSYKPKHFSENPLAKDFHEENAIYEALEGKADALQGMGALKNALDCHELALKAEERIRRVLQNESARLLLQADRRRRTEKVIDICYDLYQKTKDQTLLQKAFVIAEQSRATLLREAVQENLTRYALEQGDTLWKEERETKRLYAFYEKEYLLTKDSIKKRTLFVQKNKLSNQLAALRQQIFKKYPQYQSVNKDTAFEYASLTKAIQKNKQEILIEYFIGQDEWYAFVIADPEESPVLYRFVFDQNLQQKVQSFPYYFASHQVIQNDREGYLTQAYDLYQQFVKPILSDLSSPQKAIIIPDGALNYIPFEALVVESSKASWGKVPFLLRQLEIRYAYSLAILNLWQNREDQAEDNLLAVAPIFRERERGLLTLNFSGQEIEALQAHNALKLFEKEAILATFIKQASQYRILHLSTHAQGGNSDQPPSLELIDGALFLPEIYSLDLRADLVVLSACETILGKLQQGEGVMSLARGFTYAGASSLIASLWQVNEQSTVTIFSDFYDRIAKQSTKAEALSATKLAYLDNSAILNPQKSPYYWAGFVYYGDDRSIELQTSFNYYWLIFITGFILIPLAFWVASQKRRKNNIG